MFIITLSFFKQNHLKKIPNGIFLALQFREDIEIKVLETSVKKNSIHCQ